MYVIYGAAGQHQSSVELDRASVGTVLVRPAAVDAILGPGEVLLDDGAGTRHNASTQVVIGSAAHQRQRHGGAGVRRSGLQSRSRQQVCWWRHRTPFILSANRGYRHVISM